MFMFGNWIKTHPLAKVVIRDRNEGGYKLVMAAHAFRLSSMWAAAGRP